MKTKLLSKNSKYKDKSKFSNRIFLPMQIIICPVIELKVGSYNDSISHLYIVKSRGCNWRLTSSEVKRKELAQWVESEWESDETHVFLLCSFYFLTNTSIAFKKTTHSEKRERERERAIIYTRVDVCTRMQQRRGA